MKNCYKIIMSAWQIMRKDGIKRRMTEKKNYVYAFQTKSGDCRVVIYYNKHSKDFNILNLVEVCHSFGERDVFRNTFGSHRISEIPGYEKDLFECNSDLYDLLTSDSSKEIIRNRLKSKGFDLVFEYPFKEEF